MPGHCYVVSLQSERGFQNRDWKEITEDSVAQVKPQDSVNLNVYEHTQAFRRYSRYRRY